MWVINPVISPIWHKEHTHLSTEERGGKEKVEGGSGSWAAKTYMNTEAAFQEGEPLTPQFNNRYFATDTQLKSCIVFYAGVVAFSLVC